MSRYILYLNFTLLLFACRTKQEDPIYISGLGLEYETVFLKSKKEYVKGDELFKNSESIIIPRYTYPRELISIGEAIKGRLYRPRLFFLNSLSAEYLKSLSYPVADDLGKDAFEMFADFNTNSYLVPEILEFPEERIYALNRKLNISLDYEVAGESGSTVEFVTREWKYATVGSVIEELDLTIKKVLAHLSEEEKENITMG
jgi:hypothetical protein